MVFARLDQSKVHSGARKSMYAFHAWLRDEKGAITIDWVVLTAAILLLGTMVVYSIFDSGVSPLVQRISSSLASVSIGGGSGLGLVGGGSVPAGSTVIDGGSNQLLIATPSNGLMQVSYSGTVPSSQLIGATIQGNNSFQLSDGTTLSGSAVSSTGFACDWGCG